MPRCPAMGRRVLELRAEPGANRRRGEGKAAEIGDEARQNQKDRAERGERAIDHRITRQTRHPRARPDHRASQAKGGADAKPAQQGEPAKAGQKAQKQCAAKTNGARDQAERRDFGGEPEDDEKRKPGAEAHAKTVIRGTLVGLRTPAAALEFAGPVSQLRIYDKDGPAAQQAAATAEASGGACKGF